jgi:hypothetical protein
LQVVNVPSFIVRLDSQKHIDFSLKSPFCGGRPGCVKRKNAKKGDDAGEKANVLYFIKIHYARFQFVFISKHW